VPGARVFVFGTTEWGALQRGDVLGSLAADGSLNGDGVHLVTPSSWSKVGLTNSGFRDDHVHVVPLGFDARTFRPGSAEERARLRSALGLPPDAFIFLSVGAMTWNKGIGPLLAAFAIHRRRNPQSRLVLKGADAMYGRNLDHALAEVRHLAPGVWNREAAAGVTYIGSNLTRAELTGLFQASDAYVTSYRAEGFSLPSLEALGCGLPVIATRGGPTDDFCPDRLCLKIEANLRPMRNGLRFFDPSIESIVACMQSAVDDEALRARAAVEGSAWAAQNHSWSKVTQSLAGLLYG
jgi:glycosyltransferase involved in cell wall biosynthesis